MYIGEVVNVVLLLVSLLGLWVKKKKEREEPKLFSLYIKLIELEGP